jgi:hypothetical protein
MASFSPWKNKSRRRDRPIGRPRQAGYWHACKDLWDQDQRPAPCSGDSRFSVNRHAPFKQVKNGDLLILKESGGPICGVCVVSHAWFYHLDPASWSDIEKYASALCMDDSTFWERKRSASFATLMRLEKVIRIPDIPVQKIDPRGWVVLKNVKNQRSLL